jgi:hypothetical protein
VSTLAARAALLRFDGIVHTSDLPTQAFARHLSEGLSTAQIPVLIGGMRGFLEGRGDLMPPGIDLSNAEDGEQAVEILASAAGLERPTIDAARRASRRDLAASVWAVDKAAGLDELLTDLADREIAVFTTNDDPAAAALLESEKIAVDRLIGAPFPAVLDEMRGSGRRGPAPIVIGTRWAGELSVARAAGCVTVLVDRRGTGVGCPTVRCSALTDVGPLLVDVLAEHSTRSNPQPWTP